MNIYCTKGTAYTIMLNYGTNYNDVYLYGSGAWYRSINGEGCNGGLRCTGNPTAPDGLPYYYASLTAANPPPGGFTYDASSNRFYASGEYGSMSGATKGDAIAYKITVPDDDGNYWSGVGLGEVQTLPIKATAVTGIRGSSYPAPDSYSSTVTVLLNY